MQVCNCTTPAQYFHLLRRQMYGGSRPARHAQAAGAVHAQEPAAASARRCPPSQDFTAGGFREVIGDASPIDPERVTRVVFCSGKIYYDLLAGARGAAARTHVAIVRVEQLYPFAESQVHDVLLRYPLTRGGGVGAGGAAQYGAVALRAPSRSSRCLSASRRELRYVGRPESASPAGGSGKRHQQEQTEIVSDALAEGSVTRTRKVRLVARRKK